jgi:ribose transport system substrate-binding protein
MTVFKSVICGGICTMALALGCGLASPARAAGPKTIEFIPSESTTPYFLREYDGIKQEAAKYGYKTIMQAPFAISDVSSQINITDTAITRGVAGIILVPSSPTALLPPVRRAMARKIEVIATDSTLTPMDAATFIAVPNAKAAAAVADYGAKMVNGQGQYAIIDYSLSTSSGEQRNDGFHAGMAKYPGMKFAGLELSNGVPQTALQETTTLLERNPKINVIFGANDRSALGVAQAVARLHLQDKVVVVGFDADLGEIGYIKSGVIKASVLQSPVLMGEQAVDALHTLFGSGGQPMAKDTPVPFTLVTSKNVQNPASVSAIQQYIEDYKG